MIETALAQMKAAREKAKAANEKPALRHRPRVAHYRLGRFQKEHYAEALAILALCDQEQPATLAFLAMTQHQLGQNAEGQATCAHLRKLMRMPVWAKDQDSLRFLVEVETLMLPTPAGLPGR